MNKKDHFIDIRVDERTCKIYCDDDRSHRKDQDTFGWVCHHGDLEIAFTKNGTPFQFGMDHFTSGVHGRTQPLATVDPSADAKAYQYNVKVTLPGGKVCEQDPQIIIDEGMDPNVEQLIESGVAAVDTTRSVLEGVFNKLKEGTEIKTDPPDSSSQTE